MGVTKKVMQEGSGATPNKGDTGKEVQSGKEIIG